MLPELQQSKFKTPPPDSLQNGRQRTLYILIGLHIVVHHDDRSAFDVAENIGYAGFRGNAGVIIFAEYIPHDDIIAPLLELIGLSRGNLTVGRPENFGISRREYAVEHLLAVFGIPEVIGNFGFESAHMVVGMISDFMPGTEYPFGQIRISDNILAHHKKTGFGIMRFQAIQNPGGEDRRRTVVEGQKHRIDRIGNPEGEPLAEEPYYSRGFSRGFQF